MADVIKGSFAKFVPFQKMEDVDDGLPVIWGIATKEIPDCDNEVCSYDSAKPVYQAWAEKAAKRTKKAGQALSLGNLRLQHSLDVAGKVTKLQFNDGEKEVWLGGEPLNDEIHQQIKDGFYTGFSQGGSYAFRECMVCETPLPLQQANNYCPKCDKTVTVLYGLRKLAEVSVVDSPCSDIGFEHVKTDGSRELVKFKTKEPQMEKDKKTKRVAGEDLTADCFAYVGDPEKTETWKLPIKFSTEEKTKRHIRNALARFGQTKGIPADEKEKVKAKIVAAAKKHGIDVEEETGKVNRLVEAFKTRLYAAAEAAGLKKNLWDVGRLAEVLQTLVCLYENAVWERDIEGDDSEVPDDLAAVVENLIEIFIASATEEATELAARTVGKSEKGVTTMTPEEQEALNKAAKKSLASHFAKSAHHHEKMEMSETKKAEHHTDMAETHKAMHEKMKKADVGDGAHAAPVQSVLDDNQEYHKAAGAHHAAMAKECAKCAKSHGTMAEHNHAMAESNDAEEHAKCNKEFKDAAPAADAVPVVKIDTQPSIDDDVTKSQAALRETTEYKASIDGIAKARIEAELAELRKKAIVPDGVKIADVLDKGIHVVERDAPTFNLVDAADSKPFAGMA